jgi:hypothetical protein
MELEESQDAEFLIQEERMAAGRNIEQLLGELDKTKAAIAENEGATKKARSDMSEMFGDEKAGYDSNLSSMETEQSFNTAFMMKSQLDDKRQGMMEYSKALGEQRNKLFSVGEQLGQQYEQMQNLYKNKYGTVYIPQRAIQAQKQKEAMNGPGALPPPHPASGPMGAPPGFENGLGMAHTQTGQAPPPGMMQHPRAQPPHGSPMQPQMQHQLQPIPA